MGFFGVALWIKFFYGETTMQVACQSLGPLKNGGAVVGIDIKVIVKLQSFYDISGCF